MSFPPLPRQRLTLALSFAGLLAVGGITAVSLHAGADEAKPVTAAAPAATVDVAVVTEQSIIDWQDYSGRLEAVDRVDIRPLVAGTLTAVHFKDGSLVRKGDVLFTIDPRPYAAEVDRARAALTAAEARATYTATDLTRSETLVGRGVISRRDFDAKQNEAAEAAANRQAAQAALTAAKLNLAYTRITAPVDGRVSRAEVTVGNIVSAGAGPALTTLVSVSPIYAAFDVDEQSFLKFINPSRAGKTAAPVALGLANEAAYSRAGRVSSVDNRLDISSGTIRVRAVFENKDGSLLPGLYARIRLGGGAAHPAVLVDEKAIGTDQAKRFVLVLDDKNHAAYREVQLGAMHEGLRVVESGLKGGERIVVNGLQRVRPGDIVAPNIVPMTAPATLAVAARG